MADTGCATPGGKCVLVTILGAAVIGGPLLGLGVILAWCAVSGRGASWPVDLLGSAVLCCLGAVALFGSSCLMRRAAAGRAGLAIRAGGGRRWIVAAGVSGGIVLPCAIARWLLPMDALPGAERWTGLLIGWGILAALALGKCRPVGTGRVKGILAGAWMIAMGAGRTGAAVLLMDAIDGVACQALPRLAPDGWGPAGWVLGMTGVILLDERGLLPLHLLGSDGCGSGRPGCVLREGARPA